MNDNNINYLLNIEEELSFLGLLDKAKSIYRDLGDKCALTYLKTNCHLLLKAYSSDLNLIHDEKSRYTAQKIKLISNLLNQATDEDLICIIKKGLQEKRGLQKKILVVEDEFGLQETFREVFSMEGYEVRVAMDGESGFQTFLSFNPDLIFTDVVMPKMSGIELVKKIRTINPKIKVIYISGFFGLKDVKREMDEEILKYKYPYLSKPFKITTMLELVYNYLK